MPLFTTALGLYGGLPKHQPLAPGAPLRSSGHANFDAGCGCGLPLLVSATGTGTGTLL
jgi:hypothetical protein